MVLIAQHPNPLSPHLGQYTNSTSHRPLSHQLMHHHSRFLRSSPFQYQASVILAARLGGESEVMGDSRGIY